jgi:hypothetical protein
MDMSFACPLLPRSNIDALHRLRIELRKCEELEVSLFCPRRNPRPFDIFGNTRVHKSLNIGIVPLWQNKFAKSTLYFDPDTHTNLHSIQRTDNRIGELLWP